MFKFNVSVMLCSALITILYLSSLTESIFINLNNEWSNYKREFGKDYSNSATGEAIAYNNYRYNKQLIANHNRYYRLGRRTFGLRENQFTDMRLVSFNALFPTAIKPNGATNSSLPAAVGDNVSNSFNPIEDLNISSIVENQGTACNSGWAYAAAKSIELLKTYQTGVTEETSLSAQNLIDCAGQSIGCTRQVPQAAFDYMTRYAQELYYTSEYPNRNDESMQGMCILPQLPPKTVTLQQYAFIDDGDDETMKRYLNAQFPIVIEFNPTSFEFMHYAEGVFQQPSFLGRGSHFITLIGYGTNSSSNLNYFIAQNSFNTTWGENGLIKIAYSNARPLAKSAILPIL